MPAMDPAQKLIENKKYIGVFAIYLAFFLSGMSGLIYQTVWVRMLTRYLGSTTASTATVLCVFMSGLALGAWLGGKYADQIKRKLAGYVVLEIAIAASGILMSFLVIAMLGGLYVNFYPWFGKSVILLTPARIIFCALCFLLPAFLMGATLPFLIAFITQRKSEFQQGVGQLYSINTFGAVLGVFITGFFLIGALGESSSLFIAALLNLLAAFLVYRFQRESKGLHAINRKSELKQDSIRILPSPYPLAVRVCSRIAIFISGFSALAYEILWTRYLMLPLRTSVYAFSLMLGIFLMGIALGSWLSSRFKISETRSAAMFALSEIFIGFLTTVGMVLFLILGQISEGYSDGYLFGIFASFLIVFPVAIVFGWQFPIAVRCCVSDASYPGKETGGAYSVNTAGAILGSIFAAFILIPTIGTAISFMMLAIINAIAGIILLGLAPKKERGMLPAFACALIIFFALLMIVSGDPYRAVIEDRISKKGNNFKMYAFHEGIAGNTVPAGDLNNQFHKHLFINGVSMTALVSETKLMAHLPLSLLPDPQKILIICFGMGTTVRSASKYPVQKRAIEIDAVDIVPKVFDCFQYFHQDAKQIASLPNVHLYADDGRNFMLVHEEGFYDVISIDPAPPLYSAGSVNLHTREFFELCKSKISRNGVVCMWLPPSPKSELLMVMKTFINTFPGASLWGGVGFPGFYLIGGHRSFDQTDESLRVLSGTLSKISDLSEWDPMYGNPDNLKGLYLLGSKNFTDLLKYIPEVTDDRPYTEFPLWRGVLTEGNNLSADDIRRYIKARGGQTSTEHR